MESLWRVYEESSLFQTVPLDSTWSLWRLLGNSRKCFHGFPWSPHGVHVDSLWTPQESSWTPWKPVGQCKVLQSSWPLRHIFCLALWIFGTHVAIPYEAK